MKRYKNASFTMAGAACLVLLFNFLLTRMGTWERPMVPGFHYLTGLCYPILAAWVGILLRNRFRTPHWAVQIILFVAAGAGIWFYAQSEHNWWWPLRRWLCLSVVALGYLLPPSELDSASERRGWHYLALALMAVFCYAATSLTQQRLLSGSVMDPENFEMERLLETVLAWAEPLLTVIATYLVTLFSFSKVGLTLGASDWIRGIVAVPFVILFICRVVVLFTEPLSAPYTSVVMLLLQPATVYIVIVASRLIKSLVRHDKISLYELLAI